MLVRPQFWVLPDQHLVAGSLVIPYQDLHYIVEPHPCIVDLCLSLVRCRSLRQCPIAHPRLTRPSELSSCLNVFLKSVHM